MSYVYNFIHESMFFLYKCRCWHVLDTRSSVQAICTICEPPLDFSETVSLIGIFLLFSVYRHWSFYMLIKWSTETSKVTMCFWGWKDQLNLVSHKWTDNIYLLFIIIFCLFFKKKTLLIFVWQYMKRERNTTRQLVFK